VFDADLQLICSTDSFGEILALPPHSLQLGIPLREILEFMGALSCPGIGRQRQPDGNTPCRLYDRGRTLSGAPPGSPHGDRRSAPTGCRRGLVITFSDVTPSSSARALDTRQCNPGKAGRDRTEELTL